VAKPDASFSIRRKIADLIGSERLLTAKEKLQDFNARVERLQNMIEARTHDWVSSNPESPLPDNQQFYQLKRLFPGKRAGVNPADLPVGKSFTAPTTRRPTKRKSASRSSTPSIRGSAGTSGRARR
jgi:hypothetical protein